jgi:hypothetical protein
MILTDLTEAPLTVEERTIISGGDSQIISGKLREIDCGQYLVVARIGEESDSADNYVRPLITLGVDIGDEENQDYGVDVVSMGNETKEVRVYRR